MDPEEARLKLNLFVDNLPDEAFIPLRDKEADPSLLTGELASAREFMIRETGALFEGVLRVVTGVDSPSAFLAFVQKDPNIDEMSRPKLPELAYDIQTKVFDVVLPILKQAGLPVKEGRVPQPVPTTDDRRPTTGTTELNAKRSTLNAPSPALEEKNMRALLRIAAGTAHTEEELRNAFEDLPLGLRQSISSVDTANSIQEIAKKYLLHVDQMAALASETGLVLLGLTHPADFIKNLASRLRVPEEKAREIARDVSAQVLVKVRESLRNLHAEVVQPPPVGVGPRLTAQTPFAAQKPNVTPPKANIQYPVSSIQKDKNTERQTNPPHTESYKLEAFSTPYSAQAKWNTGEVQSPKLRVESTNAKAQPPRENILANQVGLPVLRGQAERDEPLDRAKMLQDIENPKGILSVPKIAVPPLPSSPPTAKNYQPKASPVGPTGWTPSANTIASSAAPLPKYPLNKLEAATPAAPPPASAGVSAGRPAPLQSRAGEGGQKLRPQSESAAPFVPPTPKKKEDEDFLDQKLQTPMSVPNEEKRYTSDPYREPIQ